MSNTPLEAWRGTGMRYGIIAGGACVTLFAICYFVNRELVLNNTIWFGSLLIYAWAMWRAQSTVNSPEFKDLVQPGFLVFIVANALFHLYYHLLLTVFDPGLVDLQREQWVAAGYDFKLFTEPTVWATINTYIKSLVGGFVLAALVALGLKRQRNA